MTEERYKEIDNYIWRSPQFRWDKILSRVRNDIIKSYSKHVENINNWLHCDMSDEEIKDTIKTHKAYLDKIDKTLKDMCNIPELTDEEFEVLDNEYLNMGNDCRGDSRAYHCYLNIPGL